MAQCAMRKTAHLGLQAVELQGALHDVLAKILSSVAASGFSQIYAFANEMDRKLKHVIGGAQRQILEQKWKELHALKGEMHGL